MSRPGTPSNMQLAPQMPPPPDPNFGRLMQVKVLYTFDDSKSNCLARCPQPVPVRTAMLDATTEVGIIELRTCIQAIVNASPELVAKLGQDFTIYAYDYSEYETPLVGQGMLSWALASTSATPTAPAQQSQTPVTGRVTRGGMALFNGGGETLEVKLKLVPVPSSLQSDYLESMQKYRDASTFTNQGGDAAAWNSFLQANPGFAPSGPSPALPQQGAQPSFQQQTFQPQESQPQYTATGQEQNCNFQPPTQFQAVNTSHSQPNSRPSTPTSRQPALHSRQSSRASSTRNRPLLQKASSTSQVMTAAVEEQNEFSSEQPRKRARVQQTSWRGPSALKSGGDLRVAASTAASIRGHGAQASSPAAAQIAAAEPPVRPPTPRPSASRQLKRTNTSLAHDAIMHRPTAPSRLAGGALTDNEGSVGTSPESQFDSAGSSPTDIPSSPPLMAEDSLAPSSPALPQSASFLDSGFGSGGFEDLFSDRFDDAIMTADEDEVHAMPPSRRAHSQAQPALTSELSITEELPGDPNLLPQRVLLTKKPPQPGPKPPRKRRAPSIAVSSPTLKPQVSADSTYGTGQDHTQSEQVQAIALTEQDSLSQRRDSTASLPAPAIPASFSVEPTTEAPEADDNSAFAKINTERSGVRRREVIKERLEADLREGKLPQYCRNCGEIETPTWRKCFVKHVQGPPPDPDPRFGEEGYLTHEPTEKNEMGEVIASRIVRRTKPRGAEGREYEEFKLCNSCGIFLFKIKKMRPKEKWGKPPARKGPNQTQSKKRNSRGKSATAGTEPQSDAGSPTDDADNEADTPFDTELPQADAQPFRTGEQQSDHDARNGSGPRRRSAGPELDHSQPPDGYQPAIKPSDMEALQRAIQSSPPKFPGSQASPIDIEQDQTSPSVRRLLFPSPRKEGHMKTLDGFGVQQSGSVTITVSAAEGLEKENADAAQYRRASTPTAQTGKDADIFKTPSRRAKRTGLTPKGASPGQQLRRSPRQSPSKYRSPAKNPVTPFTATMNQMMSDPIHSPTSFSDQFNLFSDNAFATDHGNFNFDFGEGLDGYATDMPVPQSDADYFPVFDFDGDQQWDGGPLADGELEALLQEANDNSCETYFAAIGTAEGQNAATPATTANGATPGEQDGAAAP